MTPHFYMGSGSTLKEALQDAINAAKGEFLPHISVSHAYVPPHGEQAGYWTVVIMVLRGASSPQE
jgi:hypothetical protein